MTKFFKNILATIWIIGCIPFWVLLSTICPQLGLEEIGELSVEGE